MKFLFVGDIFGRSGREALAKYLPDLKEKLTPDMVIVNGDNAAHGRGITRKICEEFFELGVDCITGGDHVWDQSEILNYIGNEPRLLRPANYSDATPGAGVFSYQHDGDHETVIIHLQGQIFMRETESPFQKVDTILEDHKLGPKKTIFVDLHCEATSEKMMMGQYLDGRVSGVVGTHTHVPTADAHILDKGTGYQTDMGMCGDYNSVIGARTEDAMYRFLTRMPRPLIPAEGEATLCGTYIETDDQTGLTRKISPIRVGPRLAQAL